MSDWKPERNRPRAEHARGHRLEECQRMGVETEHQTFYGEEKGFQLWTQQLEDSIDKIQRRLGGVRYKEIKALLSQANKQQPSINLENYKELIKVLLIDYYDPMYDFQLNKKKGRVVFKGEQNEVIEYLSKAYEIR